MRQRLIFPLVIAAAVLAGCESAPEATEQATARVPHRDLTLPQLPAAPAAVASAIEIPRTPPNRSATRPRRVPKSAPVSHSTPKAEIPPPAVEATASEPADAPALAPAPAPSPPPSPRELAPGQTVTVIPASSGPSVVAEPRDEVPSRAGRAIMRGRGGTCRPRGAL